MAVYARQSLSGWEQGDDAEAFARPSLSTWEQSSASGAPGGATATVPGVGVGVAPGIVTAEGGGSATALVPGVGVGVAAGTISAAVVSNDIQLRPSIRLERGGYAASLLINRWWVLTADLTAVAYTGASVTLDATGRPIINLNGAIYNVGDNVPMWFGRWDAVAELSRTVRSGLMWVPAVPQA